MKEDDLISSRFDISSLMDSPGDTGAGGWAIYLRRQNSRSPSHLFGSDSFFPSLIKFLGAAEAVQGNWGGGKGRHSEREEGWRRQDQEDGEEFRGREG